MVHHSNECLGSISPVFEGNGELGLVVLWVVHAVGLDGDVWAIGGGTAGGLETGGCGCGEEGEGEDLEAHFGLGVEAGWVSRGVNRTGVRCYLLV